jgi:uncharacterized protein YegP (UPF0339 family)
MIEAMKTEGARAPDDALVELWKERTGEWRWRYTETRNHTRLLSNEDYRTRQSAERAARLSYPGVPVVERARRVEPGSNTFWLLLVGGGILLAFVVLATIGLIALVMIVLGLRGLRRPFTPLSSRSSGR